MNSRKVRILSIAIEGRVTADVDDCGMFFCINQEIRNKEGSNEIEDEKMVLLQNCMSTEFKYRLVVVAAVARQPLSGAAVVMVTATMNSLGRHYSFGLALQ